VKKLHVCPLDLIDFFLFTIMELVSTAFYVKKSLLFMQLPLVLFLRSLGQAFAV